MRLKPRLFGWCFVGLSTSPNILVRACHAFGGCVRPFKHVLDAKGVWLIRYKVPSQSPVTGFLFFSVFIGGL
jgi:hypothetical protein